MALAVTPTNARGESDWGITWVAGACAAAGAVLAAALAVGLLSAADPAPAGTQTPAIGAPAGAGQPPSARMVSAQLRAQARSVALSAKPG